MNQVMNVSRKAIAAATCPGHMTLSAADGLGKGSLRRLSSGACNQKKTAEIHAKDSFDEARKCIGHI